MVSTTKTDTAVVCGVFWASGFVAVTVISAVFVPNEFKMPLLLLTETIMLSGAVPESLAGNSQDWLETAVQFKTSPPILVIETFTIKGTVCPLPSFDKKVMLDGDTDKTGTGSFKTIVSLLFTSFVPSV